METIFKISFSWISVHFTHKSKVCITFYLFIYQRIAHFRWW